MSSFAYESEKGTTYYAILIAIMGASGEHALLVMPFAEYAKPVKQVITQERMNEWDLLTGGKLRCILLMSGLQELPTPLQELLGTVGLLRLIDSWKVMVTEGRRLLSFKFRRRFEI